MIFDSFWRKYSSPSQNALNPHLFSLLFLQNHWFLRGNELFCPRTVGFWEEIDFFAQEPLVFERKWTFLCQNRWFLRGNGVFCPRTVGFWEEMDFFAPEPLVFERKWTFLPQNRWFLRGNQLFCPRTVDFWEEMNFFAPEPLVFERKWPFTLKNTLELETKWSFAPKVYLTFSFVFVYLSCFFNFLVKNKNGERYLLSRASEMNFKNWKHWGRNGEYKKRHFRRS